MAKPDNELTWKDLEVGYIVTKPGSAKTLKTGDWRSDRPIFDNTKCSKCGSCYLYCPDCCVVQDAEGFYAADLYYCKGCGICAVECPNNVITMVQEEE